MPSWLATKPRPGIEAVGVGPALVGGQLDQGCSARLGPGDRLVHHRLARAAAAQRRIDAHGSDLRPPGAAARQAGDEAELEAADHPPVQLGHHHLLVRVGGDRGEGGLVRRIDRGLAILAQRVVRQQPQDRRQVSAASAARIVTSIIRSGIPSLAITVYRESPPMRAPRRPSSPDVRTIPPDGIPGARGGDAGAGRYPGLTADLADALAVID